MTAVEPQAAGTTDQLVRQLTGLGGLEVRDNGATRGAVTVRMLPGDPGGGRACPRGYCRHPPG